MRRHFKHGMTALLTAMLSVLAAPVLAQTPTCSVTITDMNFGADVDTLSGSVTDTEATITYNCSGGSSERILICVYLGEGSVPASGGSRLMSDGNNTLAYQLYRNTERSMIWGSAGSGNSPPPIAAQLASGAANGQVFIYGRVSGGQSGTPPSSYSSTFSGGDVNVLYRVTNDNDCTNPSGTQASTSFNVTATVAKECLVSTASVSFGSHGVLNADVDAEGAVNVRCTPATNYSIRLNGGGAGAGPTERLMSKVAASIQYGLYRDDAREQPWGDTGGAMATGTGNGTEQPHVVYGRVPPQTTPAPGVYNDTVLVTVDYD